MVGLMAKKIGMMQLFDDSGSQVPVTVIRIDPNMVIAQKTPEKDGYSATILGINDIKPNKVSKPYKGQFPQPIVPKRNIREFRDFDVTCSIGDTLGVELFEDCRYVDVTGISKGKGFQGVMKRHGFSGGPKAHGSKFRREPGSTGQNTFPGRTFKNTKLPGRMGREKTTVLSLRVIRVDVEKQLLLVHGSVPGVRQSLVVVRAAVKR